MTTPDRPAPRTGRELKSPAVAVIGGGFSGLLTAVHLLRADPDVRVHLIERAARIGPGRAYATSNPGHLLNVRAANMSAFPDDPDHFRRWLDAPAGDVFVTRGCYGDYLQEVVRHERDLPGEGARLVQDRGEAIGATRSPTGWRIALSDGRQLEAQAMVLALGFLEPAIPADVEGDFRTHPAYIADPWAVDLRQVAVGNVLLLGTGLTMVDVALSLDNGRRRITALSRRGLLPQAHGPAVPAPSPGLFSSPISCLRRVRRHARAVGWRTAVDSLRWVTPEIWKVWTVRERRQFLRHLQPWWDIHRHRMAPESFDRLERMRAEDRLRTAAAKVQSIAKAGAKLDVTFRPRRASAPETQRFSAVINCTAPGSDVEVSNNPLVADLRSQGLLRADAFGLGLDLASDWSLKDAAGRRVPGLFAVGPLTRSLVWEAVAVPDLRRHALETAGAVLGFLEIDPNQRPISAVRGA